MSEPRWVIVAEGEGAEARIVSGDLHQELHNFTCDCELPWKQCPSNGVADINQLDDPDEWATDENGQKFSISWRHECGRVSIYKLAEARAVVPQAPADATGRTDADYAIEFGEYLAKAVEFHIAELNRFWEAEEAGKEADSDALNDAFRAVHSALGEFRKRARRARAAAVPQAAADGDDEATETRWQKRIYDLCREAVGPELADTIDGSGCDSGDALDVTVSEIKQAIGIVRGAAAVPAPGRDELHKALYNLRCEVAGWLGMERESLIKLLSFTNVCVMETRMNEADIALGADSGATPKEPNNARD